MRVNSMCICMYVDLKFTLEQAMKAQAGSRAIALFFVIALFFLSPQR